MTASEPYAHKSKGLKESNVLGSIGNAAEGAGGDTEGTKAPEVAPRSPEVLK